MRPASGFTAFLSKLWGTTTTKKSGVAPHEVPPFWDSVAKAIQIILTAAGANMLGPALMHLSPAMALLTSGIGTYVYVSIAGVPSYLGTSFSYIAPIAAAMKDPTLGQPVVAGGIIAAGITTILMGLLVRQIGYRWLTILMPPIVLAVIVMAIGGILAPVAWDWAKGDLFLAGLTLLLGIIFATKFRRIGLIDMLPILLCIVCGSLVSYLLGYLNPALLNNLLYIFGFSYTPTVMDLSPVREAPIWAAPVLVAPVLNWQFDLEMVLITMSVVLMEHIAHLKATSQIVGIDYMPRTSRSLIADGLANALSWFGTPSVTYAEIIGLLSMVKDFSLRVIKVAAVLSIIGGFSGKLPFLVLAIPQPVLGGALVLLLGMISTAGLRVLAEIDLNERKNQILSAVMLTMLIIVVVVPLPLPALVVLAFAGIATHLVIDWRAVLNEFRQPQEIELVPAAK